MIINTLAASFSPLLGEFCWHSFTTDPSISTISRQHFELVANLARRLPDHRNDLRILEVACYAHTTGYTLKEQFDAEVTLFELSASTLKLGRQLAGYDSDTTNPRLVAGDFHDLPFEDNAFDLVYICSALHHTWDWETVTNELQRVLAPGGVMFFENEPCRRSCCFYKFRVNRPHDFIDFENKLSDLGILRTVAEPYLGSRPESLFGMIENQTIPLNALLSQLNTNTRVVEATYNPESCMGDLEWSWVRQAGLGHLRLSKQIAADLLSRIDQAIPCFDDISKGLGYSLPTDFEVYELANGVATQIVNLPPESHVLDFRRALSEIFGAAIQLVVTKPQIPGLIRNPAHFNRSVIHDDGVFFAFPPSVSRFLMSQNSLLPNIQSSSPNELAPFFSSDMWARSSTGPQDNPVINLSTQLPHAKISFPADSLLPGAYLIALRIYSAPLAGDHIQFQLKMADTILNETTIWKPDSFLVTAVFEVPYDVTCDSISIVSQTVKPNGDLVSANLVLVLAHLFRVGNELGETIQDAA